MLFMSTLFFSPVDCLNLISVCICYSYIVYVGGTQSSHRQLIQLDMEMTCMGSSPSNALSTPLMVRVLIHNKNLYRDPKLAVL